MYSIAHMLIGVWNFYTVYPINMQYSSFIDTEKSMLTHDHTKKYNTQNKRQQLKILKGLKLWSTYDDR